MKEIILLTAVIFKRASLITAFVAMNAVMANLASAGPIPVVNHSFEEPVFGASLDLYNSIGITIGDVPGWDFGSSGIIGDTFTAAGLYNLDHNRLAFPGGAPDGQNSAYVFSDGEIGSGELWISQVLTATLQPNTRYRLEVDVGDPAEDGFGVGGGFPGYRIELLAGGALLAQDLNSLEFLLDDDGDPFQTSVLSFTTSDFHPNQGGLLEIKLVDILNGPGFEVDFDNVRLTVPEPATLALFGLGLAGLGFARRKKA